MMPKYKIRIRKVISTLLRKATVLKRRKCDNMFNEYFYRPTIVYYIVDTVHTVLAGINLVISEAAC